ncbi:hypothetical protein Rsub_08379 [Raphidocelis subcapitata]|uniref:PsbP C-terminal domain-containing protein n=1 Tax=Raphidocelis subcapitata TaxID=307507 RepID=A0A2V0PE16_9CHLO|nr:hypothetical protein Rsub_08379 [Raphidocelis subcapitata]|eukprot:GBF95417.1 hypothetical protein Rsub_08379 [Raphidocelis subcapitata]
MQQRASNSAFQAAGRGAAPPGARPVARGAPRRCCAAAAAAAADGPAAAAEPAASTSAAGATTRRAALGALAGAPLLLAGAPRALAVQGLTAGRIPGVSETPDAEGFFLYKRPEGKSGGHGVGWSEIPRYSFRIPGGWDETPVSIADLGGTEIDLRFADRDQGNLVIVVAPVARFAEIGFNADIRIEELGPPDKIIAGFAPELYGAPLNDDDVLEQGVVAEGGLSYYRWLVRPHRLVSATAVGNRLFIISVTAPTARQWRKHEPQLRSIQESFRVPAKTA